MFATRTVVVCARSSGIVVTLIASLRPALRATRVSADRGRPRRAPCCRPSRFARFGAVSSPRRSLPAIGSCCSPRRLRRRPVDGLRLLSLGVGILAAVHRRGDARADARAAARLACSAGPRPASAARPAARPRQLDAQPDADGLDRVGADDRPGARDLVAVLAPGIKSLVRERRRQALHRRLRAHVARTPSPRSRSPRRRRCAKAPASTVVSRRPRRRRQGVRQRRSTSPASTRQLTQVIELDWKDGSNATPAELGQTGAFVDDKYAKNHDLHVGSPIDARDADRQGPAPEGATASSTRPRAARRSAT